MANGINNKYEYRSGLLDSLNVQHTASDVRNEDEYRKKVLNGLGVEYTEDDINQKNLYRAKVVEGLASSGGGGGSSDFTKVNVTMEVSGEGNGANYSLLLTDSDGNDTALIISTEQVPSGERRLFSAGAYADSKYTENYINYNSPITKEVYLYQNNYFVVSASSVKTAEGYTITGNAEVESVELSGETIWAVKVYGDCTISVVGRK